MPKKVVKLCKDTDCKNEQTTLGYCRLHYLRNWKKIQEKQRKKAATTLNKYVDHIMKKHPDNFVDTIKHDLRHQSRFQSFADEFSSDGELHEVIEEADMTREVERIVDNIKVDENF